MLSILSMYNDSLPLTFVFAPVAGKKLQMFALGT